MRVHIRAKLKQYVQNRSAMYVWIVFNITIIITSDTKSFIEIVNSIVRLFESFEVNTQAIAE